MKRLLSLLFLLWSGVAFAQTPTPVVPGQQTCTSKSGSTVCSFLPVDTTNPLPVTNSGSSGVIGATVPTRGVMAGVQSGANMVSMIQASDSVKIDTNTIATTQIVALTASQKIYVTSFDFIAAGTTTFKFVRGTGANCGTGTADVTAAYDLTAQTGVAKGGGLGPVLVVPAGNALCITNSAAQHVAGSISYTKF